MKKLTECIAPSFYNAYHKIINENFTHYWFKGGRGSTKSAFVSIMIILKMMMDGNKGIMSNAVVIRRVKDTLKDSVFANLVWAINILGVSHLWHIPQGMLKITYIPTGQVILFRGADKIEKIKSTKVPKGWIKYIWYEETAEFQGIETIRTANQSLMRGGENFLVFYSYNPPKSIRSWVNSYVMDVNKKTNYVHSSTYLTVPREWLGEQFFEEAEELKARNEKAYEHEYMGKVTGTGGAIFNNVSIRKLSKEELNGFEKINRGVDFGFTNDPLCYQCNYYDKKNKTLYIFHEFYKTRVSNSRLAEVITEENTSNRLVYGDSAEPKTISELQSLGVRIIGAKKGKDSVHHGIKWLQDLREIVIDDELCPNIAREFLGYEYETDGLGNFKDDYPDKDNHSIDSIRYSLIEYITSTNKVKVTSKKKLF